MKEETNAIYGKPNVSWILGGFAATILICMLLGLLWMRYGRPLMHTQPQPLNNKGMLSMPNPENSNLA